MLIDKSQLHATPKPLGRLHAMKLKTLKRTLPKARARQLQQPEQREQQEIKRDRNVAKPRQRAWAANPYCAMCGILTEFNAGERGFNLDHIVPLFEGGKDVDANKQVLCIPCHKIKSAGEEQSKMRSQHQGR